MEGVVVAVVGRSLAVLFAVVFVRVLNADVAVVVGVLVVVVGDSRLSPGAVLVPVSVACHRHHRKQGDYGQQADRHSQRFFHLLPFPLRRSDFDRAPSIPSQPFNNLKGI